MALKILLPIFLLLSLLGCSSGGGDANDIVFYKAPIVVVDGRSHSRTLLVTGAGVALGLEQNAVGEFRVAEAEVPPDEVKALMADLWGARLVRAKAAGTDPDAGVYQVAARIDREEFSFRRYVDEPVAKEVQSARERLDAIWETLVTPDDQVGAIEKFLGSKISRIRGYAVNALLSAWRSPSLSPEDHGRAEALLTSHALVETNYEIRKTLHQALSKQPPR